MSLLQAIVMGIIQGLTEFLPVSSSGHLALYQILFDADTETGMLFDVLLHVGTLIAICVAYYKEIGRMIVEGCCIVGDAFINAVTFFKNLAQEEKEPYRRIVNNSYRKFVMLVIVSTIPTGIIGFIGKDVVEKASALLIVPGICLIVTAALLFLSDRLSDGAKLPKGATYTNAFSIGIAQGIATLPGLSRSGTTVTACLLCGFNRNFAVKYSFIMSIPAVLGALALELSDFSGVQVTSIEILYYVVGMLIAAVVGYICIRTMLVIVRKKKFTYFAVYCLLVGIVSICAFFYTAV